MKKSIIPIFLFSVILLVLGCKEQHKKITYPETKKVDTVDVYYGREIPDPYRWLEDDNSKETAEWVKSENEITRKYLEGIPFREDLKKRLTDIWNYPKYSVPFKEADHYFFFKNDGLQDQDVLYIQDALDDEPRVLLDPNKFSEDGTVALSNISVSNDGKYLGYSISRSGSDWNEIKVRDIETRKDLDDHLKWVKFSGISWKVNGFYYSTYDKPKEGQKLSGRNEFHKVKYHKLGTSQEDDKLIYDDPEHALRNFRAQVTDDERYLFIYESESSSGNALYYKDLRKPNGEFVLIAPGFDNEFVVVDNIGDDILIKTNYNAPAWKLMKVNPRQISMDRWETLFPEKTEVLQSVDLIGGRIVAEYMKDAYSQAFVYDYDGKMIEEMQLPEIGSLFGLNGEKDEAEAFYGFISFTFPSTIYLYDVSDNRSEVYKESELDFNADNYYTKQVFFESKDGTKVPMFIIRRKDVVLNGNNPVLLYGYGGFNIPLTPNFSLGRLLFLEKGGIYVMVNLRGGGEYGEEWHEAGMKTNKQNVFDDFISAAEYLINNNYTNPDKIAMVGGSNGGLLVGACMTQRPELFEVAIPMVGVMDMLRYHKFTIGWAWASDYGTSEDSEEMFEYLLSYSPLHNIKEGVEYPATLVTTADHDDRVVPAHSFKFIATLQEKGAGDNPYLIRIETKAGHGAGKPTSKIIEQITDIYSFMMYNLDMY